MAITTSWISVANDSDFPIQNIPFGIIQKSNGITVAASIIGDYVIDLHALHRLGYFKNIAVPIDTLQQLTLNNFISLGKPITTAVRKRIMAILDADETTWCGKKDEKHFLIPVNKVKNLLPVHIGDYTDFYSSKEHATNVGMMFRDPKNALLPNWLHLPVGYHGRASSIVVSGTSIRRPSGQYLPQGESIPVFGKSRLLDFELETAFVIGKNTNMGDSINTADAEDYIFGMTLFNDWSARDIQAWEYVPLGPFLGKNFASTMSPWIVTMESLQPFRVNAPKQQPKPLPYLQYGGKKNYDIHLTVSIQPKNADEQIVCTSNFKYLYWNMAQQLAHHTINGCNMRVGDVCASGTISGKEPSSFGSMLELTWRGAKPIKMSDGSERKFINDGDTVALRGWCEGKNFRIGFGECIGRVSG
ncbi:MAG: fumarylacetoacetase [Saprospiraceae bacterium]|nr:fumarylacetoacetase [Saprospiraceae bacterium]